MRRLFMTLALVVLTSTTMAEAATEPASQVVERLNAGLLDVMQKAEELGFDGRVEALAEVLGGTYHLPVMTKAAVGRYWRRFDGKQREYLVDAFTRMTLATYADRFNGYSGERFEVLEEVPTIKDLVLVKNRLVKSNGDIIMLNYLTRPYGNNWRIVDVYLDAKFSELARLRSEFLSVLSKGGFTALMAKLEERIKKAGASDG